jgi:hypothetical protein
MPPRQVPLCAAVWWLGILLVWPLLPSATAGQTPQTPPWTPNAPPPAAGTVTLGQSLTSLDSALGPPSRIEHPRPGREAWVYDERGLSLLADSGVGVVWIGLFSRNAGDVAGLRVGDPREQVQQLLGKANLGRGETKVYVAAQWRLVIQLDETVEFVHTIFLGRPEFFPNSEIGVFATLKRLAIDLYKEGDALGLFGLISLTNFLLWRRYKYWVPRYVHAVAVLALLVICWLNWLWVQAGGEITTRRVLMILTFPAIVYFFFIGAGGVKAALTARSRAAS